MKNVADIIELLGGNAGLARKTGLKPSTVGEMKRRGSIPVEHWPKIIEAAVADGVEGITPETLMAANIGQQAVEPAQ
jgi:hypothetical protein